MKRTKSTALDSGARGCCGGDSPVPGCLRAGNDGTASAGLGAAVRGGDGAGAERHGHVGRPDGGGHEAAGLGNAMPTLVLASLPTLTPIVPTVTPFVLSGGGGAVVAVGVEVQAERWPSTPAASPR